MEQVWEVAHGRRYLGPQVAPHLPLKDHVAVTMETPIPAPRKRMGFLVAFWMGCIFLMAARASFASWFQKSGQAEASGSGAVTAAAAARSPAGLDGVGAASPGHRASPPPFFIEG